MKGQVGWYLMMAAHHDLQNMVGPSVKGAALPVPGDFEKAKDGVWYQTGRCHFNDKGIRGSVRGVGGIGGLEFQIDLDPVGFDGSVALVQ